MAQDVVIQGGLFDLTIRQALSEADDAVTGDKANLMNMALARGCWFQWEFTVQMELHTQEVEADLEELGLMRDLLAEMTDWTPLMLENPAAMTDELRSLWESDAGTELTNQASHAVVQGMPGNIEWPPGTMTTGGGHLPEPIGLWDNVQAEDFQYLSFLPPTLYKTADGVYFRIAPLSPPGTSGPAQELIRVEPEDIELFFDAPILASDDVIARARRELEVAIESKTQRNQEKQAQLQDIAGMLEKWITFTTNLNQRKEHDAGGLAGNFH